MPDDPLIRPECGFLAAVEERCGEKVSRCYHCRKCTNGCPVAFAMDVLPNQAMRMIQLGLEDELLRSRTIWVCASCQTCTTRCPNDIDIARVMDCLRQLSQEAGVAPGEPNVARFHRAFLDSIRRHGRVSELEMVAQYKLASMDLFSNAKLGWEMLKRGKLKFLPENVRDRAEIRRMFDKRPKEGR
jgi:heterodisulfide reductase subunit C